MLLQRLKKHWLAVLSIAVSLIVALFWLALRINWSGISKALGADKNQSFFIMETPLLFCILMFIAVIFAVVAAFLWSGKRKVPFIVSLSLSGVFVILEIVVLALGANDYLPFILPTFGLSLLISLCLLAFGLLLFFPNTAKTKLVSAIKWTTLGIAIFGTVLVAFDVKANYITYEPVVYAVENDYQIVFSTNDESIAWVEVDGTKYYDLYAGSMKSKDLVHKVTVPQDKLDAAGKYTIGAQTMIYRGPFGGYKGKVISKDYSFRAVNVDDGLDYYTVTDVHGARKGAAKAATAFEAELKKQGRTTDFLIVLGDSYSMIDSEYDAQFTNLIAHDITKGEYPVIYARGNHEIKGNYAEDLYKYVGSKNQNFYYEFTLAGDKVYGITLDLGEDHDDDWWEYYETAQFVQYQAEQTAMLENIFAEGRHLNHDYTVVCCHIPIQFVNSRHNHETVKADWTKLLNKIQPDLCVYGHQHDLYPFIEGQETMYNKKGDKLLYNTHLKGTNDKGENKTYGGYLTEFEFSGFICGRRGSTQTDSVGSFNKSQHIGLGTCVDFTAHKQTSFYINSNGEKVAVCNPFVEGAAQTEFVTDLK